MRILFALFLLGALGACSDNTPQNDPLTTHRGQWVVVNYWAQWCKPCIKEIPELNRLDSNHDDVTVLGVNYDGLANAALEEQVETLGVAFPTITDPSGDLEVPRPTVLPTSLIINPAGELVKVLVGPQTEESLLEVLGK